HQSYLDAAIALTRTRRQLDFEIVDVADVTEQADYGYSFDDEKMIWNQLKTGNVDGVTHKIAAMLDESGRGDSRRAKRLTDQLFRTGERFLAERGIDPEKLEGGRGLGAQVELDGSQESGEVRRQALIDYYRRIIELTSLPAHHKTGSTVASVVSYVEAHYRDNLNLDVIADEAGVSAKYMSKLFKEKTGVNLTDYISTVRIAKAKELLADTDMTVSAVAEEVGIYSRTTFIRLFKKYEGVTPNDYRRMTGK
ncbi:MAG: AraC family transcriptional regulator, partial [Paenibacillus sp.]|nr:AraC family transcriptional regulator [Paenibacillus sp.]